MPSATAVLAGHGYKLRRRRTRPAEAVKAGLIAESALDTAVKRLFTARMQLGMFDPPSMSRVRADPVRARWTRRRIARCALKMARESMVLLKNDKASSAAAGT